MVNVAIGSCELSVEMSGVTFWNVTIIILKYFCQRHFVHLTTI